MKRNKLKRMSIAQLDELLQAELRKDTPDEEVVLPILEILEAREQKPKRKNRWVISVAAAAALLVLLTAVVPKAVGANSLWDAILQLTDSVMQFFAPGVEPRIAEIEHTFHTDNPGLQQLYDKVTELGITELIVPTWLPEGFELNELKVTTFEGDTKTSCSFYSGSKSIIITYRVSDDISSTQYEREMGHIETYENGGTVHAITQNDELLTAVWAKNGLECMITTNISYRLFERIIDSIYRRN